MKEHVETSACDHSENLVAYLYGEACEREAKDFESHMARCLACREELTAFRRVHEDVVEWRNQSLPSFESSGAVAQAFSTTGERKRSALAALREFFTLSPAWMRAATAVAALVVCALVVFTVAHFSERRETVVQIVPTGPTQSEMEEMVNKRADELRRKEKQAVETAAPKKESVAEAKNNTADAPVKPERAAQAAAKRQGTSAPNKANASKEARQELAELVRQTKEDDSLPRLSDLIDDSNESY